MKTTREPIPQELRDLALELVVEFGRILHALRTVVADRHKLPSMQFLAMPLYHYLSRTIRRFDKLLTNVANGILPRVRKPQTRTRERAAPKPNAPPRLPRQTMWLVRILAWHVSPFGSQIAHILARPGVAELFALASTAGR